MFTKLICKIVELLLFDIITASYIYFHYNRRYEMKNDFCFTKFTYQATQ